MTVARRAAPVEWETPSCLVCGGAERVPSDSVEWRGATFGYVLCAACGLKYMSPRPTQRWYHALYEQEFWQEKIANEGYSGKGPGARAGGDGLAQRLTKQRWRAARIVDAVSRFAPPRRDSLVVDVGAAFGVTLHELRQRYGCEVAGVEPSTVARAYAEREFGIRFLGRYMEDLFGPSPADGRVGLLIFSHVLENIVDPRAALAAAARLLAPAGRIYVDTSNFLYYNAINPYHPYIFSPDTLEELLARCGFSVEARQHAPHPRSASAAGDPYLLFVARVGASTFVRPPVSAAQLVADQERGLQLRRAARRREAAAAQSGGPTP
jgi:SAM-dependent methyltransferase